MHRFKDLASEERVFQLGSGEFPPLKSLYRTNLPVPATPFLGRRSEVSEVVALVKRPDVRLVTLTGPGGTGKTRLALQAVAEAADDFPDGLWWLPLAPLRDPAVVSATAARALGVAEQPGRDLGDVLDAAIVGKRLVLLFDNASIYCPRWRRASRGTWKPKAPPSLSRAVSEFVFRLSTRSQCRRCPRAMLATCS